MEYINLLLLSDQFRKKEATIIPFRRKIKWSLLASSAGTGEFLDDENFEIIEVGEEVDYYTEVTGGDLKEGDKMIYDYTGTVTEGQVLAATQMHSGDSVDTMGTEAEVVE